MRITSIIENTSNVGLPVEHGLSLYIQMENGQKILFDMGQRSLFAENAERLGLSIADVDTAIISHGHYDHGGGLRTFLKLNSKATVHIHHDAFLPHYSLRDNGLAYIGIDKELLSNNRIKLCSNLEEFESLTLFADVHGDCCCPKGNKLLFGPKENENDNFSHEQNLIIEENKNVILFAGCAHNGIVNILRKAEAVTGKVPTHVLGGMHLVKSGLSEKEEDAFISSIATELMEYKDTMFYTMHCTGTEQYQRLRSIMGDQIEYLSCGESINIA